MAGRLHIDSSGFRDYSRKRNGLYLYRLKVVGSSCAADPYIKELLLKKLKIKGAVGRDVRWPKFTLSPKRF